MYATSADWKVNDGTWSTEQEKKMTAKMKLYTLEDQTI